MPVPPQPRLTLKCCWRHTPPVVSMMHEDGLLYWHGPESTSVFDLGTLQPNTRQQRFFRSNGYGVTVNKAFEQVIRACADREPAWIDAEMIRGLH